MYGQSNIERLKRRKKELGWSNQRVSDESQVPLGTVNKIFSGATKYPRNGTMNAIVNAMGMGYYEMEDYIASATFARETPNYHVSKAVDKKANLKTYYSLPDELRAELIDGKFYYMSPPSMEHQCIMVELVSALHQYFGKNLGRCKVMVAPCDVRLDKDNYTMVQPDIFVLTEKSGFLEDMYCNGAPEMIVEIVSAENPEHDYERKRLKYQQAGVKEYWIVDPVKMRVVVYTFARDVMPIVYTFEDVVKSIVYPDLRIDFRVIAEAIKKLP